jgi:tetratricopeptide (TPR) repeat protein
VFAARMTAQAPDMHFKWAQETIDRGGYTAGVDKLNELIELYPNSAQAQAAPDVILQAYLAWAQEAIDAQEYSDAEARLQAALSDFETDSARAEQIKQQLVAVYIAWGDTLIGIGDIDNGIARYRMAGELSPGAVDADLLAARAYLKRAIEIANRDDYERAIQKVQEIVDTAASDNVRAEANTAMDEVLTLYSQSSSLQAVDRITSAVTQVCQEQLPSLPALYGRADAPVRFGVVNFSLQLPADWGAQTPGQLHYVLCITEDQDTIQSCPYQGGHTLYRVRYIWRVKLLDIHTGEQRDSESFSGSDPDACQQKEPFARGSTTKTKFGARPGVEEIVAWLASLTLTE